jgi:hypothetical protein
MRRSITNWLKNWKGNLLEVFLIAAVVASGFTTLAGAYHIFNQNLVVAVLLTSFFQGGMYVIGHYISVSAADRQHRRRLLLCLVWALLACFSVYSSALGMFEIQHGALKKDETRIAVIKQWNEAEKEIGQFKSNALSQVTEAQQTANLELTFERNRAIVARAQRRPYSPEKIQRLTAEVNTLKTAEAKVREIKLLSITPPEETDDAQRTLDDAFSNVKDAYAALPEQVRASISEPSPIENQEVSEHVQKAFWAELKSSSTPVILIVFFALVLDLLPPLVRSATTPKRTLSERILGFRVAVRELKDAFRVPLAADTESVQVKIENLPSLNIQITIPTAYGGPLVNIDRDFAEVTTEVCREKGYEVQLESVTTISGKSLVNGLPLLKQLGQDRQLILNYISRLDSYADEVN